MVINYLTLGLYSNVSLLLLGFVPCILNFKYSVQFKVVDYFLIFIYFLYWGPIGLLYEVPSNYGFLSLWNEPLWIYAFTNICESLPLYFVAIRSRWDYPPVWSYLLGCIPILLSIIVVVDNEQTYIGLYTFFYWFAWITRVVFYAIICIIFYQAKLVSNTHRARMSKYLWIFSTALFSIGMSYFLLGGLLGIDQFNNPNDATIIMGVMVFIFLDSSFILLNILHVFYPESIILTTDQLRNLKKIYQSVVKKTDQHENIVADIGLNKVRNYLDELPEDIRSELATI